MKPGSLEWIRKHKKKREEQEAAQSASNTPTSTNNSAEVKTKNAVSQPPRPRTPATRTKVVSQMSNTDDKSSAPLLGRVAASGLVMKLIHSRAAQGISAAVGFGVSKLVDSGLLTFITSKPALEQFLTDANLMPTEAGLTVFFTGLAWAGYNTAMNLVYGNKFAQLQKENNLVVDRWPGKETMGTLGNKTTHE